MKQKKHNSRRRLNTPQNRLKRAVGYRYEKRSMMNAPHFQAARQAEENPAVISSDSFASAPVVQHDRKTRKREWVNAMVMQPNASLFKTSVHPMKTLEDAANSVYLSLGTCKGLFWNLLLWLLISAVLVYFIFAVIKLRVGCNSLPAVCTPRPLHLMGRNWCIFQWRQ
jgi:hypothetical protein